MAIAALSFDEPLRAFTVFATVFIHRQNLFARLSFIYRGFAK